jgi:Ca-activated chloride channel homolog
MEYSTYYFLFIGLGVALFWSLDFFGFLKKSPLYIAGVKQKKSMKFFKMLVYLIGIYGWAHLAYSLTQPRKPLGYSQDKIEVIDIIFVADISRSMIADDFKPNRLEAAKTKIIEFVDLRPKDRIGIVIFADKAFTLLPLSTDLNLVKEMVSEINFGMVGNGTNIGDALGLGVARGLQSLAKNKVMILLTDGVSNVGSITPLQAAEQAKAAGIKVYTIGIGGDQNAKINLGGRIQLIPGGSIDFENLQEIAKITGGKAYLAQNDKALDDVLQDINRLERTEVEKSGKILYEELYFKYLVIGVCFLLLAEILRLVFLKEIL